LLVVLRGGRKLDKAEALAVLKELLAVCPEIGQACFVSIDPDSSSVKSKGSYKIRLGINFDGQLRDCLKKILDAHRLEFTEKEGMTIIYSRNI
jgi:hypothetical protein